MESGASASEKVQTENVSKFNLEKRRRIYNDKYKVQMRTLAVRRYKTRIIVKEKRDLMKKKVGDRSWKLQCKNEMKRCIGLAFSMRFQ